MDQAKTSISLSVCQSGWQSSKAGHSYGPAVRDYYVIHYIVNGQGDYYVNNQSYHLGKGDGFLLMPGDETYYVADLGDPWEYYWVGFVGNEAHRLLTQSGLGGGNLIFSYTKDDELEKHLANIFYASKKYAARDIAMIGYLYLFFSLLINTTKPISAYHQIYLDKAIKYIEMNYARPITIGEIAQSIGIDRSYLYRIFRSSLDVSVKEYIDSFRLSKARDLLCTVTLPVADIGAMAGFNDSSQFSKKFKASFGKSPATYRKSIRRDRAAYQP